MKISATVLPLLLICATTVHAQGTLDDYRSADSFLPWNVEKLYSSGNVQPYFVAKRGTFLYDSVTRDGNTFFEVNPAAKTRVPVFDHAKLALALHAASGEQYDPKHLPLRSVDFTPDDRQVRLSLRGGGDWICDLASYVCTNPQYPGAASHELPSPDGKWVAYVEGYNVFARSTESGEVAQLSHDGQENYDYGRDDYSPDFLLQNGDTPHKPPISAIWSPDSRKLFTYRTDQRKAKLTYVLQSVAPNGGMRTIPHAYPYPLPGDTDLPTAQPVVFDLEKRRQIDIDTPPLLGPLISWVLPRGLWSKDGRKLFFVDMMRGYQTAYLVEADPETGHAHRLIEEHTPTSLVDQYALLISIIDNGEHFLWSSERTGWNHLYLHDGKTGKVLKQITTGQWPVREIVHVDEKSRLVYFTASGRNPGIDPYLRQLYRVGLDGKGLKLITPEEADHAVTMSPDGKFFVDVYSKVNTPPVAVVRRSSDGQVTQQLEQADLAPLLATGWRFPEPFTAKAADNKTDVYGVLFRPVHFDPAKKYPIIENIYPGPHSFSTPKHFPMGHYETTALFTSQAMANLGFVVIAMDGRGQNDRGRAFRDHQYRNLGDAGLDDRIAAMRQLAERYPYVDTSRVGVFGFSAGGYAAARAMLAHPEFYKVAVASAGNHDHRMDKLSWNENWMGYPVGKHYEQQSNITNASKLEGKLLLTYGDIDTNVPPASTLKLVAALMQANKNFEMLVFPNHGHYLEEDPYFIRRRWDYFVKNLLGVEPPPAYRVNKPE